MGGSSWGVLLGEQLTKGGAQKSSKEARRRVTSAGENLVEKNRIDRRVKIMCLRYSISHDEDKI